MTHLDVELKRLKDESVELFELVISQLRKGRIALLDFDKDLAREVNFNEKRVNALELKIDKDCENIFALFNPVAIDLRFVLAVLKINSNLERIGDHATNVAEMVYFAATGDNDDQQAFVKGVFDKLVDEQEELEWSRAALAKHRRYQRLAYVGITLDVLLAAALGGMILYKWLSK